jgi:hypothetical protein
VAVVAGVLVVPVVGVSGVVALATRVGVVEELVAVVPPPQAASITSALRATREKRIDLRNVFMVDIPFMCYGEFVEA